MSHYIINYYLPSSLFVVVSWVSFLVPSDVIPGTTHNQEGVGKGGPRGIYSPQTSSNFLWLILRVSSDFGAWPVTPNSVLAYLRQRTWLVAVSAQKTLKGLRRRRGSLLGGTEENSVSVARGHWFALQANQCFFTYLAPWYFIACLRPPCTHFHNLWWMLNSVTKGFGTSFYHEIRLIKTTIWYRHRLNIYESLKFYLLLVKA